MAIAVGKMYFIFTDNYAILVSQGVQIVKL